MSWPEQLSVLVRLPIEAILSVRSLTRDTIGWEPLAGRTGFPLWQHNSDHLQKSHINNGEQARAGTLKRLAGALPHVNEPADNVDGPAARAGRARRGGTSQLRMCSNVVIVTQRPPVRRPAPKKEASRAAGRSFAVAHMCAHPTLR